jgi:superfamily II DNA or RNA helicase
MGYIYVRIHESYGHTCKLGSTTDIASRDQQYATSELNRGYFKIVFDIQINNILIIERLLHSEFKDHNIRYNAGIEFYDIKIIDLIEPLLNTLNVTYKILTDKELRSLKRKTSIYVSNVKQFVKSLKTICPRDYQLTIIDKSIEYYKTNDAGLLVLICGIGKTLVSLWISQRLKCNTILIGVPNILLLTQWSDVVKIIFPNYNILLVNGLITPEEVQTFMHNNSKYIIITTYASSYKISLTTTFDMKILDECHHLTSSDSPNDSHKYIDILNTKYIKQVSLTATLKYVDSGISNDNVQHFGNIIDTKCLLWAIDNGIVCDYVIQIIMSGECGYNQDDKLLYLSAYCALKSINDGHSHHLLIYSNNVRNSEKIVKFIEILLENSFTSIKPFYSDYNSNMTTKEQESILTNFKKYSHGIISCVYCLGEGWDLPMLDGIVFAENMTSNIRIVQSALRAIRKDIDSPNKKCKIILPIFNLQDDFKKIQEVIYQMSLEDESIIQKINLYKIVQSQNGHYGLGSDSEQCDIATKDLLLKNIRRSIFTTTYEKAKSILSDKGLKSKEEYYLLCDKDIRLTKEPGLIYKGKFTNWIDYLNIKRVYYDLETCKSKVREYLLNEIDTEFEFTNIIKSLNMLDHMFPPYDLWCEYYDVNDLIEIIKQNKNEELVEF